MQDICGAILYTGKGTEHVHCVKRPGHNDEHECKVPMRDNIDISKIYKWKNENIELNELLKKPAFKKYSTPITPGGK